jgi:hypothetical protein
MVRRESCADLAGERPVPVIAGEPVSRVRPRVERNVAERIVESLRRKGATKRAATRVNAEQASSDYQPKGDWESRAGHVAAKATHNERRVPERALGLLGVMAAARLDRTARNTGDPSPQPASGKDRSYKARAEVERSGAEVRGVRSTWEGGEKPLEGRSPALIVTVVKVSVRACL